jgi:hypothetical protein
MKRVCANMEVQEDADADLPGSEAEPGSPERALRLKGAVRAAGGNTLVAQRSGVPLSSLNSYLRGREMKAGQLVRLAEATGVRLEWLATGAGPMRDVPLRAGDQLAPRPADSLPSTPAAPKLFQVVKLDRLQRAYAAARTATGGQDERMLLRFTLLIYDDLTDAEETAENRASAATDPQLDPQDGPQG